MSKLKIPNKRAIVAIGLGLLGLLLVASEAKAQVSAEESAKKLKPAAGLEAKLWASEPMVVNPTNIDVDSRGRVWVSEGLNYRMYRNARGEIAKQGDADKIKILEDTDLDGKADKMTVFADKIYPVPMGIAVEEHYDSAGKYKGCRVFIGNSPNLLVLEDTDGDDKADKRYNLLTGFGGVDSDHGVHGMILGLDGKLYFTHGDGCCSVQSDNSQKNENFNVVDKSGRHVKSDQLANTMRVNRDGTQFEVICDRQRNNYEVCLNSFGNIFVSDNDDDGNRGSRVIWAMDGGKYGYRTPGSPRHWGEEVPGNVPKLVGTGNGSPCGIACYEGDLLGEKYKGALFESEAGTRQINFFPIKRNGAAFRTTYEVLLSSDDPWFRPVDQGAAPDGALFVADWYDAGVGGHAFRDQTTGRIYRVAPIGNKPAKPTYDFSNTKGLIEALKSPTVAAQDAAARGLVERGTDSCAALAEMASKGDIVYRARALWVWTRVDGKSSAVQVLSDPDPRMREQAVRILGRDVSRVGDVEYKDIKAMTPLAALEFVEDLEALANDPDPGVRRELILAFRDLPTEKVGKALRTLTAKWDGQDRWYLEALGLALQNRESEYLASLFDGNLFGDLDLPASGQVDNLALPPYFPADRNEAFLSPGDSSPPATPLSKTLGLAWRIHRPECAEVIARIMPSLSSNGSRQAAEDVLAQIQDPKTAARLATLALDSKDPIRKRQLLAVIARKLTGDWKGANRDPKVLEAINQAMSIASIKADAVRTLAATLDKSHGPTLLALLTDKDVEVRSVAVEALGQVKPDGARAKLDQLIGDMKKTKNSDPSGEAAIRTLPDFGGNTVQRLNDIMMDEGYPVGARREALRTMATLVPGARRLVDLVRDKKLPAELKTDAVTTLLTHSNNNIRAEAMKVLPPLTSKSGQPLPLISELIRREGNVDKGREVFFKANGNHACASCHRVQGEGNWIGPDLSTIGVKYGRSELVRSILNPNDAIGYNYRSVVAALDDGRVVTGLPVEESPAELVLKTAEGQRVRVDVKSIEERRLSDVSLMPEGLAAGMEVSELVDLLAYLSTLRQPVSPVGQFQITGPVADEGKPQDALLAPRAESSKGKVSWQKVEANAEGLVNVATNLADGKAAYLWTPVYSSTAQRARLVLDGANGAQVWLNGKKLGGDQRFEIELPQGASDLVIRVENAKEPRVAATFVADRPLEFRE